MWPENWLTWTIFRDLRTQWRSGFSGHYGLDYAPMFRLIEQRGAPADFERIFGELRDMEQAALKAMHTK